MALDLFAHLHFCVPVSSLHQQSTGAGQPTGLLQHTRGASAPQHVSLLRSVDRIEHTVGSYNWRDGPTALYRVSHALEFHSVVLLLSDLAAPVRTGLRGIATPVARDSPQQDQAS